MPDKTTIAGMKKVTGDSELRRESLTFPILNCSGTLAWGDSRYG